MHRHRLCPRVTVQVLCSNLDLSAGIYARQEECKYLAQHPIRSGVKSQNHFTKALKHILPVPRALSGFSKLKLNM